MKALILSDLHQYSSFLFENFFIKLPNKDLYDIVIIAGDTTNGDLVLLKHIISKFEKPVYFVLGNHCYYHRSINEVVDYCLENNLNLLYGCNEYKVNHNNKEYILIGGTGWSSYNLYEEKPKEYYKKHSQEIVNDFKLIYTDDNKIILPDHYETLHNTEWNFYSQYKNKENVILITHFPMSKVCLDPYYAQSIYKDLNPYFINNKDTSGFKLIISGHTHSCLEATDEYGCTHIVNAYGYGSEFQRIEQDNIIASNGFNSHTIVNMDNYL